jgi:DNA-directed RNA polymerase subunit RPC12/RpoP
MKETLSNESKPMKRIYDEYYKCGTCDSTYHVSMLDKHDLLCKDCNQTSLVPHEARVKSKNKRK